jgi:cytochrome c2
LRSWSGVYELLLRSEGYLQELFHYYALLSLPHDRICFVDFRRLVRDFRILTLVSMQETSDIVKATIGAEDIEGLQLRYPEFILCLEAIAMIGYSRHPYGDMRMTSEDKVERLLVLMVGSEGSRKVENSMEGGRSLRKWIAHLFQEQPETEVVVDPLDDEMRLRLKEIFLYYSSFIESFSIETMKESQFRMFCRDCNFIQPRENEVIENRMEDAITLRSADVDVIYVQAVKDQERKADSDNLNSHLYDDLYPDKPVKDAYMNFEGFQDAVVMLAAKYRPEDPLDDAVRQTLKDTIYIHAGVKHEAEEEAEEWDNEMLTLFQKAKKPLKGIFDHYAKLTTGHTTLMYKYMTMESFVKFSLQFHLCPLWLTKSELADIFRAVCDNNDVEKRLNRQIRQKGGQVKQARKQLLFQFPEFIDALAMVALRGLGKEPYCERYPTAVSKVEMLLTQMEASEAKTAMRLPLLIRPKAK